MPLINLRSSPLIWATGLGVVALLWAASGLHQPLWVDELHSSWVIADDWDDLTVRARQGNQTSGYFAALKCLVAIFGTQVDWLIRIPSVFAWSVAVGSSAWMLLQIDSKLHDRRAGALNVQAKMERTAGQYIRQFATVSWCACVLLDAGQYFYAVEARVYAIVQLLNLWAWYVVFRLTIRNNQTNRWLWLVWILLACAMLHLHITSALGVIFQCALLTLTAVWTSRDRVYCFIGQVLVGVNAAWLLFDAQSVWQRRQQWATFAGDGSFSNLITLFPFLPLLIPVATSWLAAGVIERVRASGGLAPKSQADGTMPDPQSGRLLVGLWGIAALAPCLLAWMMTRYNIAPMFHYRFVMVSALPLYLFAGIWWLIYSNSVVRYATLLVVFSWINLTQGPIASQQQGRWHNERQEDWRNASEFVRQNYQAQSQSLWCYAGLIEGVGLKLPITEETDEYLSYPLRGSYRISNTATTVSPHGLVADRKLWLQQIRQIVSNANATVKPSEEIWIIYRGGGQRLTADLKTADMHQLVQVVPIRQFGRVSVVCIKLDTGR